MHGEPLDEVIYCEVMFDQGISGEIPEHRDFICRTAIPRLKKWGIPVTVLRDPSTYVDNVTHLIRRGPKRGMIRGFPLCGRCAIQRDCKARPINRYLRKRKGEVVQYIGIASDEQERLVRLEGQKISLLDKYGVTRRERMSCADAPVSCLPSMSLQIETAASSAPMRSCPSCATSAGITRTCGAGCSRSRRFPTSPRSGLTAL